MTLPSLRDMLVTAACMLAGRAFRHSTAPVNHGEPRSVVVLKPCCLGDLLLATPALAALRRSFPDARIAVATGRWSRPALQNNPDVDEVLEWDCLEGPLPQRLLRHWDLVQRLRRRRFDMAVVLDRSPLAAMVAWQAGIPVRAGLDSGGRGFSLTHPVPAQPGLHEAALYLSAVRAIAPGAPNAGLVFRPRAADRKWAEQLLAPAPSWVALHPGGGINPGSRLEGKRWPADRFGEIAARLRSAGYGVVLAGGAGDTSAAAAVAGRSPAGATVAPLVDLTGKASFAQLAALLERCRLFVGNDTGPMHLACAVRTPVVAIFGPSSPAVYGPLSPRCRVIHHNEQCNGCRFRGGLVTGCHHSFACTRAATVDEVWAAIQELLAG